MPEHKVRVENGKYEFIQRGGWKLDILRHGEPWAENVDHSKAIGTMMAELDAARVVLEAARHTVFVAEMNGRSGDVLALRRALSTHDACVGEHQPKPSEWARSYCLCAGADSGCHDQDCDRPGTSRP